MRGLYPDMVLDSVCELAPDRLRAQGIRAILADLDGTLALQDAPRPPEAVARWLHSLREAGFPLVIITNNGPRRAQAFCDLYSLTFFADARKPRPEAFHAACRTLSLPPACVLVVGDKLHTDIRGAHRAGLRAALVKTIGANPIIWLRRLLEAPFVWRARRMGRMKGWHT